MTMRRMHLAMVVAVMVAATQVWGAGQVMPEMAGPALASKAKLSDANLAKAATTSGREQVAALLRFASDQMLLQPSYDASDWKLIARDQGIIKDEEGLKTTAGRIQKALDKSKAGEDEVSEAMAGLAGAFAWAGDKASSAQYAAKVATDADPEVVGRMRAEMGDLTGVDAAMAAVDKSDREFTYGTIAEDIWLGDPVMGERLMKKVTDDFKAVHYASAGEIERATKIAETADSPYYWACIVEAYEEKQDIAGEKKAMAAFLKTMAGQKEADQKADMFTTFSYQMRLDKAEEAAVTAQKMVKYGLAMIEVSDDRWHVRAGEAACAAARLGDDAGVKSIVDAVDKMPNDKGQHEYVAEAVLHGRAMKLMAGGKVEDAIALAKSITRRKSWGTWKAKEDLYRYAVDRGDLPLGMKIEEATGTTSMLHWVVVQLVQLQIEGKPLAGKPVDVFAYIDQKKSSDEIAYDKAEAAIALAEDLIRLGAGK